MNDPADEFKVLVLDAHSNATLSILQSLGRAGYRTSLAGSSPNVTSWCSRYARERFVYPDPLTSSLEFKSWLVDLQQRNRFDFVLPVTDNTIYPLMELRRESRPVGVLVLPTEDAFPWVFDKTKTVELAKEVGVPVPETVLIDSRSWDPEAFNSYPLFVKPVQSKVWSRGKGHELQPRLARDRGELETAVEQFVDYGAVGVQAYVRGPGVGIGVFCEDGEVLVSFAYQRVHEYPLTGGASTYRMSIEMPQELLLASERMLHRIRWQGVAMVEFKRTPDVFWLMEINGRFWGSLPLPVFSGVDFPRILMDYLARGRRPAPQTYRRGLYARKPGMDFVWFKENVKADRTDPYLLTRPVVASLVEPLRILLGNERWDHATWRDPRPIVQTISKTIREEIRLRWKQLGLFAVLRRARSKTHRLLDRSNKRRILVLCYGNICRSPFVGQYLGQLLDNHGYEVRSSGFHPRVGRRTPDKFQELAREMEVRLEEHRSSMIDEQMIDWADLIVIMDCENYQLLHRYGRQATRKSIWLGAVLEGKGVEIRDPYGESRQQMRAILTRLKLASEELAARIRARPE